MRTDLNLKGVKCPLSLIRFRSSFHKLSKGDQVHVMFDDPQFVNDLRAYCLRVGYAFTKTSESSYVVTKS